MTSMDRDQPKTVLRRSADDVVRAIVAQIECGALRPGFRLPGVRALAVQHGVAFETVRRALGRLSLEGVVQCQRGAGTFVRSRPVVRGGKETAWACLMLDQRPHILGNLTLDLTRRLMAQRVLPVNIACYGGDPVEQYEFVLSQWINDAPRALVVQPADAKIDAALRLACGERTRVITLMRSRTSADPRWHSVDVDEQEAFRQAAEFLVGRGHKRIGLMLNPRQVARHWPQTHRKATTRHTQAILGAAAAMRAAGLDHGLTIHYNLPVAQDPSGIPTDEANVSRMASWLGGARRPTAVIARDYRLGGLRLAARRVGMRLGTDLAAVAVTGDASNGLDSELPLISLRFDLIAQELEKLIVADASELGDAARHVVVPPKLIAPPV